MPRWISRVLSHCSMVSVLMLVCGEREPCMGCKRRITVKPARGFFGAVERLRSSAVSGLGALVCQWKAEMGCLLKFVLQKIGAGSGPQPPVAPRSAAHSA